MLANSNCSDKYYTYEELVAIADKIREGITEMPTIGIICGSGLSNLAEEIENPVFMDFSSIPGWPVSHVVGHISRLVFGKIGGKNVMALQGRSHFYEGKSMAQMTMPVRVMSLLGVTYLIVTNAAGGVNAAYSTGDLMVLNDHYSPVCMAGNNPLVGPNMPQFGSRFLPTSNIYDRDLVQLVKRAASMVNASMYVHEGCYAHVSGPNYESPAEIRFLQAIGVDAVGMSTVPEILVAHHCGIRPIGISLITNECVSKIYSSVSANHAEVLAAGLSRAILCQDLVRKTIELL